MPKHWSKPSAVLPAGEKKDEMRRFGLKDRIMRFSFKLNKFEMTLNHLMSYLLYFKADIRAESTRPALVIGNDVVNF